MKMTWHRKKPEVKEKKENTLYLWDFLHDSILLDVFTDINNNRIILRFNIICMEERLYSDDYETEIAFTFTFDKVSELICMTISDKEKIPEKKELSLVDRGWMTTRGLVDFIVTNSNYPMEVSNAQILEIDKERIFSMDGMFYYSGSGEVFSYFEELRIKYEKVHIVDHKGVKKTLGEIAEMGRKYWEEWSKKSKS
jgi:hypothetical protein